MEKKEIHHPAETFDVYTMEAVEMPQTSKSPSKQKEPVLETPKSTSFQFTAISTPQSSSKSVSDLIQKYRQIREPSNSPLIKFSSPEIASAHQDNTPKVGEMVYSVKRLKLNEIPNNNLKARVESNVEHLNVKERNGTLSDNFREKPEVNPTFKPRVVVKSAISVPTSASGKIKAKSPKSVSRMHSSSSLTLSRSSQRSVLNGTKKHTEVRTALDDDETHVNTPTRTVKRKASMSSPHCPLVSSSSLPVSKLKIKVPTAKRSISGLNFTPSTSLPNTKHITSGPSSIPSSQLKQPSQIHQPSLLRKPSVKKLSTAAPSWTESSSQGDSDQKVIVKTGIKIPAVGISSKLPVSRLKMPSVVSKGKT
ncbi:hypothetical protein BKA69DRAFT_1055696 [Paraphysoderma sedebokerense]|nr:hypothetical protein BKA69DRAFT_1055696 [Paraphysoderma sedebokerense]